MQNYQSFSKVFLGLIVLTTANNIHSVVDDVRGDSGTAQTGSLRITGGTSGLSFDSTSTNVTGSVYFLSMPLTSTANGQIIIDGERVLHVYGEDDQNIFAGGLAGNFTLTGTALTACGYAALQALTSGIKNTAVGTSSLSNLTTGTNNVVMGVGAGSAYTSSETNNVIIGSNAGVAGESDTIRIGGDKTQTHCYIGGIYDAIVEMDTATTPFLDINGQLGTYFSARDLKKNIHDINNESKAIYDLRPVSFTFKADATHTKQYGLIADEVDAAFPDMAIYDKTGKPINVRYHFLPVLLLNELQKLVKRVNKLENN